MSRLRALTPAEHTLDRARQALLALGLEIDALAEGRTADVAEMRAACARLERELSVLAGAPSAVEANTRHALPDRGEVDEPAEGDAFSAAFARADHDRSPSGASVFPGGAR